MGRVRVPAGWRGQVARGQAVAATAFERRGSAHFQGPARLPDTRTREHPIRIASSEWTAVTGVIEGTFMQAMPIGPGTFISPTGRKFKLQTGTIGRCEDGVIAEEWLFWDNQSLTKQIGLVQ